MNALYWIFIPIALVDSLSVIPLCLIPLSVILAGPRPLLSALLLILGIFVVYFPAGVLITLGLDHLSESLMRFIKHPTNLELSLQIVLGLILIGLAYKSVGHRGEKKELRSITPFGAFSFGALFTLFGLWGAFPYFAAIDQLLRTNPTVWQTAGFLLWYNTIFVLPLLILVGIGFFFQEECKPLFTKLHKLFDTWGERITVVLFMVIGAILVADGIGWLLGYPLIPV
jgi:cytochrome c biogenesis protein CcdA